MSSQLNPGAVEFVPGKFCQPPQSAYNAAPTYHTSDVDPIEIEARCEAVIEILQDDQVRNHLNPESQYPNNGNPTYPSGQHTHEPPYQSSRSSNSRNHNNNSVHYSNYNHQHQHQSNHQQQQQQPQGPDDEEEMMEMMAMQEECRLEMMKFYIQSQNPNLFEEIYHDVSYPEGVKKPAGDEQLRSSKAATKPAAAATPVNHQ